MLVVSTNVLGCSSAQNANAIIGRQPSSQRFAVNDMEQSPTKRNTPKTTLSYHGLQRQRGHIRLDLRFPGPSARLLAWNLPKA